MLDNSLFIHPLEEPLFNEMIDSISFNDEVMYFYENYTEKARKPDLYGKTVKITPIQFGEIFSIAQNIASLLSMQMPNLFVYEDFYYGVESKGAKNPWIEISAKTMTSFTISELTFLLAKEMCEIKLKHTYYYTLVNEMMGVMQNHSSFIGGDTLNDIWKITMYKWCRMACYSSDSFGYIACGSLNASISAIKKLVLNNVELANEINLYEYIKQADEINKLDDEVYNFTKADEMLPYGPFRVKNLISYASTNKGIAAMKLVWMEQNK